MLAASPGCLVNSHQLRRSFTLPTPTYATSVPTQASLVWAPFPSTSPPRCLDTTDTSPSSTHSSEHQNKYIHCIPTHHNVALLDTYLALVCPSFVYCVRHYPKPIPNANPSIRRSYNQPPTSPSHHLNCLQRTNETPARPCLPTTPRSSRSRP